MTELFIGLDAGSSVCKAAAFDTSGTMVAVASEPTPLARTGDGRVERDACNHNRFSLHIGMRTTAEPLADAILLVDRRNGILPEFTSRKPASP